MEQVPVNKLFPPPPNQEWQPTPWGLPGSPQPTLSGSPQSTPSLFPPWNVPPAHTVFAVRPRIRDGSVGGSQSLSVVQHIDQAKGDDTHHVCTERQQEQEEVTVIAAPDAVVDPGAVVVKVLGRSNESGHKVGGRGETWRWGWTGWWDGHLYAVVADAAVGTARWTVEVAGCTPLHSDLDAPYIHILVQRGPEVILLILVLIRCEPEPGEGGRKVTSLAGEPFPNLCQPTHQDPPHPRLFHVSHSHSSETEQIMCPVQGPTSGEDARVHEGGHAEVGQDKEEDDAIVDGNSWGHSSSQPWAPALDSRIEVGLGVLKLGGEGRWQQMN